MNKTLIVGDSHHNTLGLIESLGRKHIFPYVIFFMDKKKSFVQYSKYITQFWICHSEKDVINCMMTNFHDKENKAVVYTASDATASVIDKNFNLLSSCFFLPSAKSEGRIIQMMDKEYMSAMASSVGLRTPKSWMAFQGNFEILDVEYPCITKAASYLIGTKKDTTICHSKDELIQFMSEPDRSPKIIIEKFVDKDIEFQFMGLSIDGGKEIIVPGHSHIYRPNGIQNEFFFEYKRNDSSFEKALEQTREFVKQAGYSGLFSVEFLRDKNGCDYFLEMNFRNDGNAICVTDAGYNLPYIWYLYCIGADYTNELENCVFRTVYWMPDYYYFKAALLREISWKKYFKDKKKANSFANYFKDDKKPFWKFLINRISRFFIVLPQLFK